MWKKASEAFKDFSSLCVVNYLAPRSSLRNPDIEAAVIKATSHSDSHIDYQSAQRIFAWIRISSHYVKPVLSAITTRMEKTRSWTVALKGLMLVHGVLSCKVPAVQRIGRLPFNFSNFTDRNPNCSHHQAFIRAYYKFLDKKASFLERKHQERTKKGAKPKQSSMMQDLAWLENLQELLDVLMKIKPQKEKMMNVLVLEAMDCIMIEIFDIYVRICNGIAGVLVRIYSAAKWEAGVALSVLQKASVQGEELAQYVQFCKDFGVLKASECPKIVNIRQHDIKALEEVINSDAFKMSPKKGSTSSDSETAFSDDSDQEHEKLIDDSDVEDLESDEDLSGEDMESDVTPGPRA